jgi:MoaA/NifB/PqqE/SkfB family radical SAM enzyme
MLPQFLFLDMTKHCNFKCVHCDYWKNQGRAFERWREDSSIETDVNTKREIIREFSTFSNKGSVVLCGGESTLEKDYFAITAHCRALKLACLSVTNGSTIDSENIADRFMLHGPTDITVSLDSPVEEINDEARGVKGAFSKAVNAVNFLVSSRNKLSKFENKIHVMTILCERNYRDLDKMYDLVLNTLKADKLKLNVIQPTFGRRSASRDPYSDPFFGVNYIKDYEECVAIIQKANEKYKLNLNFSWIGIVREYLKSVAEKKNNTSEHICNSGERNIMVDLYGSLGLCFNKPFSGGHWKKPGDLKYFWDHSDSIRERMSSCNRLCGISHSFRKESATAKI